MNGQQWCERYGVTFDWSAEGFHADRDGWEHQRFTVTLRRPLGDGSIVVTLPWRQGLGVETTPSADGVLWAVAQDVQYGALDWDDFARELGYDEHDARLSEYRSWESCRELHHTVYDFAASQAMFEDFCNIEEGDA